jgi:hypothetical protein
VDVNAFYYTFSTICQTLSGAFGFLVAITLYEMQRLGTVIRNELFQGRSYRTNPKDNWDDAFLVEDWETCIALIAAEPLPHGGPQAKAYIEADHHAEKGKQFFGQLKRLRNSVGLSASLTFAAILASLLLLPWSGDLAKDVLLGRVLLVATISVAIASLASYGYLVWNLIKSKSA